MDRRSRGHRSVFSAVLNDDSELLKGILGEGDDAIVVANAKDDANRSALSRAAEAGSLSCATLMLSTGCDITTRDSENGWTAAHHAVYHGSISVAALLAAAGGVEAFDDSSPDALAPGRSLDPSQWLSSLLRARPPATLPSQLHDREGNTPADLLADRLRSVVDAMCYDTRVRSALLQQLERPDNNTANATNGSGEGGEQQAGDAEEGADESGDESEEDATPTSQRAGGGGGRGGGGGGKAGRNKKGKGKKGKPKQRRARANSELSGASGDRRSRKGSAGSESEVLESGVFSQMAALQSLSQSVSRGGGGGRGAGSDDEDSGGGAGGPWSRGAATASTAADISAASATAWQCPYLDRVGDCRMYDGFAVEVDSNARLPLPIPVASTAGIGGSGSGSVGFGRGRRPSGQADVTASSGSSGSSGISPRRQRKGTYVLRDEPVVAVARIADSAAAGEAWWHTGVFSWGLSDLQLGFDTGTGVQAVPRRVDIPSTQLPPTVVAGDRVVGTHIVASSAGRHHTLLLRDDGVPLVFGLAQGGRLGAPDVDGAVQVVPVALPFFARSKLVVTSVSAGDRHSLAVCSDGSLWAWGSNVVGACGTGLTSTEAGLPQPGPLVVPTPRRVEGALKRVTVTAASAGAYHSCAISSDGGVWSFGSNWTGQLAQKDVPSGGAAAVTTPPPATTSLFPAPDAKSRAGFDLSADTSTHIVWLPKRADVVPSILASAAAGSGGGGGAGGNAFAILAGGGTSRGRTAVITQVAAADAYTLAVTSDGELWQCGNGSVKWSRVYCDAQAADSEDAVAAVCESAAALTAAYNMQTATSGSATAGSNEVGSGKSSSGTPSKGKKGSGKSGAAATPTPTPAPMPMSMPAPLNAAVPFAVPTITAKAARAATEELAAAGFHVLPPVTNAEGSSGTSGAGAGAGAGSSGSGSGGSGGSGFSWSTQATGSRASAPASGSTAAAAEGGRRAGRRSAFITQVAAGKYHAVALDAEGCVWTWGSREDVLGHGSTSTAASASGSKGTAGVWGGAKRLSSLARAGVRITAIAAGVAHSAAVSETGLLYTWGTAAAADKGLLGHGKGGPAPIPRRVQGVKQVLSVTAAETHTVAVTGTYRPPLPPYRPSVTDIALATVATGREPLVSLGPWQWQVGVGPGGLQHRGAWAYPTVYGDMSAGEGNAAQCLYSPVVTDDVLEAGMMAVLLQDMGVTAEAAPAATASSSNSSGSSSSEAAGDGEGIELPTGISGNSGNRGMSGASRSVPSGSVQAHTSLLAVQDDGRHMMITVPSLKSLCERSLAQRVTLTTAASTLAAAEDLNASGLATYCGAMLAGNAQALLAYICQPRMRDSPVVSALITNGRRLLRWRYLPPRVLTQLRKREGEQHKQLVMWYKTVKRREYEMVRPHASWRGTARQRLRRALAGTPIAAMVAEALEDAVTQAAAAAAAASASASAAATATTGKAGGHSDNVLPVALERVVAEDCMRIRRALFVGAAHEEIGEDGNLITVGSSGASQASRTAAAAAAAVAAKRTAGPASGAGLTFQTAYDAILAARGDSSSGGAGGGSGRGGAGGPGAALASASRDDEDDHHMHALANAALPHHLRTTLPASARAAVGGSSLQSSLDRLASNLAESGHGPRMPASAAVPVPAGISLEAARRLVNQSMIDDTNNLLKRTKGLRRKLLAATQLAVGAAAASAMPGHRGSWGDMQSSSGGGGSSSSAPGTPGAAASSSSSSAASNLSDLSQDQIHKLARRADLCRELWVIVPFIQALHALTGPLLTRLRAAVTDASNSGSAAPAAATDYIQKLSQLEQECAEACTGYSLLADRGLSPAAAEALAAANGLADVVSARTALADPSFAPHARDKASLRAAAESKAAQSIIGGAAVVGHTALISAEPPTTPARGGGGAGAGAGSREWSAPSTPSATPLAPSQQPAAAIARISTSRSTGTGTPSTSSGPSTPSAAAAAPAPAPVPASSWGASKPAASSGGAAGGKGGAAAAAFPAMPSRTGGSAGTAAPPTASPVLARAASAPSAVSAAPPAAAAAAAAASGKWASAAATAAPTNASTSASTGGPVHATSAALEASLWDLIQVEEKKKKKGKQSGGGSGTAAAATANPTTTAAAAAAPGSPAKLAPPSPALAPPPSPLAPPAMSLKDILAAEERAAAVKAKAQAAESAALQQRALAAAAASAQQAALNARLRNAIVAPVAPVAAAAAPPIRSLADIQREQEQVAKAQAARRPTAVAAVGGGADSSKNAWGLLRASSFMEGAGGIADIQQLQQWEEEDRKAREAAAAAAAAASAAAAAAAASKGGKGQKKQGGGSGGGGGGSGGGGSTKGGKKPAAPPAAAASRK